MLKPKPVKEYKTTCKNMVNNIVDKPKFDIKEKITLIISFVALIISLVGCVRDQQVDYYNRKISKFSYYYQIINNSEPNYPENSDLSFVTDDHNIIEVPYPTVFKTKITAGLPAKRKIIVFNSQSGDSASKIKEIKTLNSAEDTEGRKNENLEYSLGVNFLPAYKIKENQYLSYYFIYSEGVDGYKSIDCVYYQIFKDQDVYQAFVGIMDSIDLGLRKISIKEDNRKVEYTMLLNFFENNVFNDYDLLSKDLKESMLN